MPRRRLPSFVFVLFVLGAGAGTQSGCVSIEHLTEDEQVEVYGGVAKSWDYITDLENPVFGRAVRTVDFPLTLIFDTLILPVTVPIVLSR